MGWLARYLLMVRQCAPGARVLLVATQIDRAEAPPPEERAAWCERLVRALQGWDGAADRAALPEPETEDGRAADRWADLDIDWSVHAVSAKTLEGVPALRAACLDNMFDSKSFPEVGVLEPLVYARLRRHLGAAHRDCPYLVRAQLQAEVEAAEQDAVELQ